ncbi:MAG: NAD(P)-dependent glycerol-3-phosphate dehydrogenase [Planctomycetes bacterium]|nr:NAD(P)-dependent glycerol-3-phosphate dehydrogenase [Planctomycetota bacterium]
MKRTYLVLGNGGFGTALAVHLDALGHAVRLWGHNEAYTGEMATTRRNPRYLPNIDLSPGIEIGSDCESLVAGAERVLAVVPTQHVRGVMQRIGPHLSGIPVVSCSKGMEESTARLPSEVLAECIEDPVLFVLTGPCHAEELAALKPATLVLAGPGGDELAEIQEELSGPTLRLYRSQDRLGAELGGALKNVIAIAAGISDGLELGDNAKSALLTRGIAEMSRFGVALGADRETFFGLAGIGDLITTSVSPHGRNRRLGELLGRGQTLASILAGTQQVSEGVWTCRAVLRQAAELGVPMPISEEVAAVLFDGKDPRQAVEDLMTRLLREESEASPRSDVPPE